MTSAAAAAAALPAALARRRAWTAARRQPRLALAHRGAAPAARPALRLHGGRLRLHSGLWCAAAADGAPPWVWRAPAAAPAAPTVLRLALALALALHGSAGPSGNAGSTGSTGAKVLSAWRGEGAGHPAAAAGHSPAAGRGPDRRAAPVTLRTAAAAPQRHAPPRDEAPWPPRASTAAAPALRLATQVPRGPTRAVAGVGTPATVPAAAMAAGRQAPPAGALDMRWLAPPLPRALRAHAAAAAATPAAASPPAPAPAPNDHAAPLVDALYAQALAGQATAPLTLRWLGRAAPGADRAHAAAPSPAALAAAPSPAALAAAPSNSALAAAAEAAVAAALPSALRQAPAPGAELGTGAVPSQAIDQVVDQLVDQLVDQVRRALRHEQRVAHERNGGRTWR